MVVVVCFLNVLIRCDLLYCVRACMRVCTFVFAHVCLVFTEDERVLNLERSLKFQLDEIDSCHQSLGQHVHGLQRELSALEISQLGVAKQLKPLFEKMMLLKMAAEATYKVSLVAASWLLFITTVGWEIFVWNIFYSR